MSIHYLLRVAGLNDLVRDHREGIVPHRSSAWVLVAAAPTMRGFDRRADQRLPADFIVATDIVFRDELKAEYTGEALVACAPLQDLLAALQEIYEAAEAPDALAGVTHGLVERYALDELLMVHFGPCAL